MSNNKYFSQIYGAPVLLHSVIKQVSVRASDGGNRVKLYMLTISYELILSLLI